MENKDDLISRRAVLDAIAKDIGMSGTYDIVESLPGQMTAAEAWEVAKAICLDIDDGGFGYDDFKEAFKNMEVREILLNLTPERAKAKIEAWRNRLRVGDVVEFDNGDRAVVTAIDSCSGDYYFLCQNGDAFPGDANDLRKTGETIDIQSVLDQLGE